MLPYAPASYRDAFDAYTSDDALPLVDFLPDDAYDDAIDCEEDIIDASFLTTPEPSFGCP